MNMKAAALRMGDQKRALGCSEMDKRALYVKNCASADGEEYGLRKLKENEINPKPDKCVTYVWY
jgi:hypothetical protein